MTEQRICCDRCGNVILETRTLLRVESGPLRMRYSDGVDLCSDCAEWLAGQFRRGQAAASPGPVGEGQRGVAAGRGQTQEQCGAAVADLTTWRLITPRGVAARTV